MNRKEAKALDDEEYLKRICSRLTEEQMIELMERLEELGERTIMLGS